MTQYTRIYGAIPGIAAWACFNFEDVITPFDQSLCVWYDDDIGALPVKYLGSNLECFLYLRSD